MIQNKDFKLQGMQNLLMVNFVQPFWPSKLIKSAHTCLLSSQKRSYTLCLNFASTHIINSTEHIRLVNVIV